MELLVGNDSCPTCESELGLKKNKLICEQIQSTIDDLTSKQKSNSMMLGSLEGELVEKENKESKLRKAQSKYKDDLTKDEVRKTNLKNKESELKKVQAARDSLEKTIVLLREQLKTEKAKIKEDVQENKLDEAREEKESLVKENATLEKTISDYEKQQEQILEIKKGIKKSRKSLNIYTTLKNIFNKNGIVADIIQNSIEEIQDMTNRILTDINGGEMTVIFETTKEVKSDKILRDTLDIKIETEAGERNYESFSGGERTIINFSIRLALSKMISKMNGVNLGFIVLDEVFGALDSFNRDKIRKVINYLSSDFCQIFNISHNENMEDCFRNRIIIQKNHRTGVSKIVEIF